MKFISDTFMDTTIPSDVSSSAYEEEANKPGPFKSTDCIRGSTDLITIKLAAELDRCKLSDRDAIHILIVTAEVLGNDVRKLIININ